MKVNIIDNDLLSIQEARILAENAYEAQQKLATFPQEKLDEIVEAMAQAASSHAKELAVMSAEETDYGKWQDKFIKNRFACEYLPAHLRNMRCVRRYPHGSGKTDHGCRSTNGCFSKPLPGDKSCFHDHIHSVDRCQVRQWRFVFTASKSAEIHFQSAGHSDSGSRRLRTPGRGAGIPSYRDKSGHEGTDGT